MTKVSFVFDKDKDLHNILETANLNDKYGCSFGFRLSKEILNICKEKSSEKTKVHIIYLKGGNKKWSRPF